MSGPSNVASERSYGADCSTGPLLVVDGLGVQEPGPDGPPVADRLVGRDGADLDVHRADGRSAGAAPPRFIAPPPWTSGGIARSGTRAGR